MKIWAALIPGLIWACAAQAAKVESVTVDHADGQYIVAMSVVVSVPAKAAYRVMTDFDALPKINDNVVAVEQLPGDHLHTVVQMCVLFFCRKVDQVQHYTFEPFTALRMTVLPEKSDLRFGKAQWRFQEIDQNSSRLYFDAQVEPDFWIPPLIGPWIVQKKMKGQALITSEGIEKIAVERGY